MRRAIITFFGCGDAPFASGTFGSAGAMGVAVPWCLISGAIGGGASAVTTWNIGLGLGVAAACVLSVAWGEWAVAAFENHPNTRKPGDPGAFVLDEVAGQWLSLIAIPFASPGQAVAVAAVQFFFFRLFDVLKPPPGRRLEKLPHGWGILCDDLSSAIYANVVGQIIFRAGMGWA